MDKYEHNSGCPQIFGGGPCGRPHSQWCCQHSSTTSVTGVVVGLLIVVYFVLSIVGFVDVTHCGVIFAVDGVLVELLEVVLALVASFIILSPKLCMP